MISFDTFKDLNDDLGLNIDTQDIGRKKFNPCQVQMSGILT